MIGKKHTTKGVCESGSESKPPLTIIGLYFETVKEHIFILYQRVDSAIGITVSISGFTAAQALSMLSSDTKVLPFTFRRAAEGHCTSFVVGSTNLEDPGTGWDTKEAGSCVPR